MIPVLRRCWTQSTLLARDTIKVWWATLPRLLWLVVLGETAIRAAIRLAAIVSGRSAWLALGLMSVGVVINLATTILALRTVGQALGVRSILDVDDDRDQSVARLLAITLLPFIGIWSTFGGLEKELAEMHTVILLRSGELEGASFVGVLNPTKPERFWLLLGVVVGAYVLRRALDLLHDKLDIRPLGLAAAFVEGFFSLCGVLIVTRLLWLGNRWLQGRRVAQWVEEWGEGFQRVVHLDLGFLTDAVWPWLSQTAWPLLTAATIAPLTWFGVALLVYGNQGIDAADVLQRGLAATGQTSKAGKAAAIEVQEIFFDGVDRFAAMWNAARLVISAGAVLLASYLVTFAVWEVASWWFEHVVTWAIGPREVAWWEAILPVTRTLTNAVTEPVRLALIATATVHAYRSWSSRATAPEPPPAVPVAA